MCAGRRSSKLVSLVTSCFTGSYVRFWPQYFPDAELQHTPIFDGRAICYPTDAILRDYLAWRQADTHINNQASQACNSVFCCTTPSAEVCECADEDDTLHTPAQLLKMFRWLAVQHMLLGACEERQKQNRSPKTTSGMMTEKE